MEGATEEKKKLLRIWMQEIQLAPESLQITMTYRLPELVMNRLVAGAHFGAIHDKFRSRFQRHITLPLNGRHTRPKKPHSVPTLARVAAGSRPRKESSALARIVLR